MIRTNTLGINYYIQLVKQQTYMYTTNHKPARGSKFTFDVSVHHSSVVEGVHCLEYLPRVVSYHVVSESLLGGRPQRTLGTILHEDVELIL